MPLAGPLPAVPQLMLLKIRLPAPMVVPVTLSPMPVVVVMVLLALGAVSVPPPLVALMVRLRGRLPLPLRLMPPALSVMAPLMPMVPPLWPVISTECVVAKAPEVVIDAAKGMLPLPPLTSRPRVVAPAIAPPLIVTGPPPNVSRLTAVVAALEETVAKVTPLAPTVLLTMFSAVPLVVERVLVFVPVSTVTVPLVPVALNAVAVVVVSCRPPFVNFTMAPALLLIVTAGLAAVLIDFVVPLKTIVPALHLSMLMPVPAVALRSPLKVSVPRPPATELAMLTRFAALLVIEPP